MADLIRGIPLAYEPKRINRFYVRFPDELGIEVWSIQKAKRPALNINKTEVKFMNETNYVAGAYAWQEIDLTFLDVIGPSTSQQLMEWTRLHVESLTGRMGYAAGYKKDLLVFALDPTGVEVEKWLLEQCQIVSIDFGENSYDDDGLATVNVKIQPWRCILNV